MAFDFNEFKGDSKYVSSEEKEDLATAGTIFIITGVKYEAEAGFKGTPRYLLEIALDGVERFLSFGTGVSSRDQGLAALVGYLDDEDNEAPEVYLEKVGRSFAIRSAGL